MHDGRKPAREVPAVRALTNDATNGYDACRRSSPEGGGTITVRLTPLPAPGRLRASSPLVMPRRTRGGAGA